MADDTGLENGRGDALRMLRSSHALWQRQLAGDTRVPDVLRDWARARMDHAELIMERVIRMDTTLSKLDALPAQMESLHEKLDKATVYKAERRAIKLFGSKLVLEGFGAKDVVKILGAVKWVVLFALLGLLAAERLGWIDMRSLGATGRPVDGPRIARSASQP